VPVVLQDERLSSVEAESRLAVEEKTESARRRTLARELEWVSSSPVARHAKSKARLAAYERLLAEERNVKLLGALLKAEGYATLTAGNRRDALAEAVQKKPDLILLDVMMGEMGGFETVAWLKGDPGTAPS